MQSPPGRARSAPKGAKITPTSSSSFGGASQPHHAHSPNSTSSSSPSSSAPSSSSSSSSPSFFLSHPLSAGLGLSPAQAESIWSSLRVAIREIQCHNASKLRFEELYRNAYTLVLHKYGEMLYRGVQECLSLQMDRVCEAVRLTSDERFLSSLCDEYWEHETLMVLIRDFLMYLDREFCRKHKLPPVYDLGLLLFRDRVVRQGGVHERLKALMLDSVRREREGELIDRRRMKEATMLLVRVNVGNMEVYRIDFEQPFLSQTHTYYQQEAQRYFADNSCSDYLAKVELRMMEEEARCDAYLDHSSKAKVQAAIQEELIGNYAKAIVDDEKSGAVPMMRNGQDHDLRRMYTLFSHLSHSPAASPSSASSSSPNSGGAGSSSSSSSGGGSGGSTSSSSRLNPLDHLRECMAALVKATGIAIVNDKDAARQPHLFMQQCLSVRQQFTRYVEQSFSNDRAFVRSLKESLEAFLNSDARSAHFLSLYLDDLIRRQLRLTSEADVEHRLNEVISLFRYLQDKDVFEEHYKQLLAQRLLAGGGAGLAGEVERSLIGKLKAESGHQFTSRLEGMFKDMELSKALMTAYNQHSAHHPPLFAAASSPSSSPNPASSTELSVQVLTTGFWPMPSPTSILLPPPCQSLLSHFSTFYSSLHSGRRLTWQHASSNAELRCTFDSGRKELLVHGYAMVVLLLYNTAESYTFAQLQQLTLIPRFELARHLLSLAHPSVRILRKSPNTKLLEDSHHFAYNTAYTSKLYRNKPPLLSKQMLQGALGGGAGGAGGGAAGSGSGAAGSAGGGGADAELGGKRGDAEGDSLPPAVLEARKNRVEASVVRIMKARKSMEHNALLQEVAKQLSSRFAVEPAFVKKRLESLIERDYIERDKDNRRLYHYLA